MKRVTSYEFRMNNSTQHTVAHLECGHERTFEYGTYPKEASCWTCEDPARQRANLLERAEHA